MLFLFLPEKYCYALHKSVQKTRGKDEMQENFKKQKLLYCTLKVHLCSNPEISWVSKYSNPDVKGLNFI